MTSTFAPFRHRAYALVWTGAFVSNVGTWMEITALSYYVAETSSAGASGLVAAAGFAPSAILGPLGSAWADRFSRRRIMVVSNALAGLVGALIAVLVAADAATPGRLALCSLAAGCVTAVGFPAFQATLPDLVPPDELVAAIGLSSTQWNLGRIIGPSAAALAIAIGGVPAALWANAASFVAVIVAVSLARIPHRAGVRQPVLRSIADGVRFARTTPAVRAMVPIMLVTVLVGSPFIAFIAQMATNVFDSDQTGTSVLVTAQGVGAVAAGTLMGRLTGSFGLRRVLVGAVLLMVPGLVVYGAAPALWVAAPALVVVGGAYMASLSSFTSVTQQSATPELRGRAMVVNNFALGAMYPLGVLVQGTLADATSLRAVTIGSGALLGAVALAVRVLRPHHTAPIAGLERGSPPDATHDAADIVAAS